MNRAHFILLCAAAALAGWGGMAWWRGAHAAPVGKTGTLSPADGATAPGDFARPAGKLPPGANPGLSTVADALAQARALDLDDEEAVAKLHALPPGTARDLAKALLAARRASRGGAESPPFNPFADLPADAKLSPPTMEELQRRLLAGDSLAEFPEEDTDGQKTFYYSGGEDSLGTPASIHIDDITRWAGLDPAAASETILKMPPGKSRTAAVDAAAKVMSRDNPQAAWDLVLKSGEQKLGEGAARAWLECSVSAGGTGDQSLAKLPGPLRDAILRETAGLLNPSAPGSSTRVFTADELTGLAKGLRGVQFGPGKEALLTAMMSQEAFKPEMGAHALTVRMEPETGEVRVPEMEMLTGREAAKLATEKPEEALSDIIQLLSSPNPTGEAALLKNAISYHAPEVFAALARAGHVKEVGPLVEHIPDAPQRRAALESILPQWMDADPAAARAAFNAAPFTALERERWQRHPAFLLNPESAGK